MPCSRSSPGTCRTAAGTAWSRGPAGCSTRSNASGSARPSSEFLRDAGIVNEQTLDYLAAYRFSGDIWGYAGG